MLASHASLASQIVEKGKIMRMTIEKALEWAYREELGKAPLATGLGIAASLRARSGSGPVMDWAASGAPEAAHDRVNRYGVLALRDPFADEPHPDAVTLGEAVLAVDRFVQGCDLDAVGLDAYQSRGEAAALWKDAMARALGRVRVGFAPLLVRRAIVGDRAEWVDIGAVEQEVRNAQGGPAWFRMVDVVQAHDDLDGAPTLARCEVDGYDRKRKRPYPDAYRKYRLEPDPTWMLVARAEHAVWCAALDAVFEQVQACGGLRTIALLPREVRDAPWQDDVAA